MAVKKKNSKSMEEILWDSANKLRGSVEPSEYKHVVLSLIFLKFASDKFEERRIELINEGKEKYLDMIEFYAMKIFSSCMKNHIGVISSNMQSRMILQLKLTLHFLQLKKTIKH